ncbi:MAG: 4Fe-4S dicluster domain-containing protein [Bacteroidales bacterium]
MDYIAELQKDIRFKEGLSACMNCGICSAICPAAEVYNYDPRVICNIVQEHDNDSIEELLKSETIWYCGECMSCKTRCPRGNTPGFIIMALRALSQDTGLFVASEKGRQQLYLKRTIGQWILDYGYCLYMKNVTTHLHPELGTVWDWIQDNWHKIFDKMEANFEKEGEGVLRKIPQETLNEIRNIFEVTGAFKRYEAIEQFSVMKAKEMKLQINNTLQNEYIEHIYSVSNNHHQ